MSAKFYPFRAVCYATMERAAAAAMYGKLHADAPFHDGSFTSWGKERSAATPYHYLDGVKFGVADTDLAPGDKFTTEANARPCLVAEQATDEQGEADEAGPSGH